MYAEPYIEVGLVCFIGFASFLGILGFVGFACLTLTYYIGSEPSFGLDFSSSSSEVGNDVGYSDDEIDEIDGIECLDEVSSGKTVMN